jgi:hypothetical protein
MCFASHQKMRFSMADPTAQPGLKEELAPAIKEMDTRTSSFSEAEVFDKLRGVLGNKQVPPGRLRLVSGRK